MGERPTRITGVREDTCLIDKHCRLCGTQIAALWLFKFGSYVKAWHYLCNNCIQNVKTSVLD